MNQEIERKFLLSNEGWRGLGQGVLMRQGYLSSDPDRVVRVRIAGDTAFLTIKSRMVGLTRGEWEYPLPLDEARTLLESVCIRPVIDKVRYRIPYAGMVWEVDEFFGDNAGLVVAEIELRAEGQTFDKPDWIGAEVSDDVRYFNANLLKHPYCNW